MWQNHTLSSLLALATASILATGCMVQAEDPLIDDEASMDATDEQSEALSMGDWNGGGRFYHNRGWGKGWGGKGWGGKGWGNGWNSGWWGGYYPGGWGGWGGLIGGYGCGVGIDNCYPPPPPCGGGYIDCLPPPPPPCGPGYIDCYDPCGPGIGGCFDGVW